MLNRGGVAVATALLALSAGAVFQDDRATPSANGGFAASARAGDGLDPSFSGDGILRRDFFGRLDEAFGVTVLSDGGILVDAIAGREGGRRDRFVLGYRADGSVDRSFGRNGVLRAPTGKVVEQSGGKFLVLGSTDTGVAVARISRDGSPDRSFGQNGVSVIPEGALGGADCIGSPVGAAFTQDGRIVIAGGLGCGGEDGGDSGIYVARLHGDGRLDPSFGRAGTVISYRACSIAGITIQRSGRIVVAGSTGSSDYCFYGSMLLMRLRADGSLDGTFGAGGRTIVRFRGGDSGVYALATDRRGRLHIGGWAKDRLAVARVLPDGRLDRTFDRDGRVTRRTEIVEEDQQAQGATGIAVGLDGRVTVSGTRETGARSQFALLRFRRDGRSDLSFAPHGIRSISFGSHHALAWDVALDADGRAIAVGWTQVSEFNKDIAIARVR